jgi:hypothetical protein
MFDQIDGSAVRSTRESAFQTMRNATAIRETDADKYLFTADSDAALKSERSGWRDYLQVAVGLLLMSAIALGGLEVFARLYANTGMVR